MVHCALRCLACRARAVWRYRPASSLSGLLPPSPASPGSGCPQLQPARCDGPSGGLSHPTQSNSASWRTHGFQNTPVALNNDLHHTSKTSALTIAARGEPRLLVDTEERARSNGQPRGHKPPLKHHSTAPPGLTANIRNLPDLQGIPRQSRPSSGHFRRAAPISGSLLAARCSRLGGVAFRHICWPSLAWIIGGGFVHRSR
jgi:hypothetical protein